MWTVVVYMLVDVCLFRVRIMVVVVLETGRTIGEVYVRSVIKVSWVALRRYLR